jgi:hypothetical protein
MSKRLLAILAVAGYGLGATAQASFVTPEEEPEDGLAELGALDADQDGRIDSAAAGTFPEIPEVRFRLRTPDTDHDGAPEHLEHIDAPTEMWRNRLGSQRLA